MMIISLYKCNKIRDRIFTDFQNVLITVDLMIIEKVQVVSYTQLKNNDSEKYFT